MTINTARPPLCVTTEQHERLLDLAFAALGREPGAVTLLEELTRAHLAASADAPSDAVRMHDRVSFQYDGSAYRDFQLVYPHEADIAAGRISVLSQVGAMLIGLSAGQHIAWSGSDGRAHCLDVTDVARC